MSADPSIDLRLVEQVEQEALVGGAALDQHRRVGNGAPEPAECLVPGPAVRDHLRDHGVEVGRDGVALGHPGVDPHARAGRQLQQRDPAGGRCEVAVRVLGVEPGLHRVPGLDRRHALEPATRRDVQLGPHQVHAGRHLGDGVLDLQPGVDLEEREELLTRVVQELDRRGAAVVHGEREPLGSGLELAGLLGRQHRRRRLLDDLLVAPLQRAVTHAQRPGGPLPVGDDLHLDVAGTGYQPLEEHHAAPERTGRLVAGALVRVGELGVGGDDPDATAATARCRLEHQGVADLLARPQRVREGVDGAAAPGSDRHTDLLGEQLRTDLVAEQAHRLGARADEGHPDALAQLGEGGVLGHESPPDPCGVGTGLAQRPLEDREVQVRPGRGGTERVRQVRLARERRVALAVGAQRDRLDPDTALGAQLAGCVDQPHRGLTPVDDRDPSEHRCGLQAWWASVGISYRGSTLAHRPGLACPLPCVAVR